jgi:hypothetical protein
VAGRIADRENRDMWRILARLVTFFGEASPVKLFSAGNRENVYEMARPAGFEPAAFGSGGPQFGYQ